MNKYKGILVNKGFAMGRVILLDEPDLSFGREEIADVEKEISRFETAVSKAICTLENIKDKAEKTHGSGSADTLNTHIMLLCDEAEESLAERCKEYIKTNQVNAEYAVEQSGQKIVEEFNQSDSDYLRARSEDIDHLSKILIAKLLGRSTAVPEMKNGEPFILVAKELSPETLSSISPELIRGIVTGKGSPLSHTAILASNLNIPYLTGVKYEGVSSEVMAAIDGTEGTFIVDPDEDTLQNIQRKIKESSDKQTGNKEDALELIKNSPIRLYANIGRPEDADKAIDNYAQGIGLFRSEFLYINSDVAPDEEEQYEAYTRVLEAMDGKAVTVRTIDIGADKEAKCISLPREANPALGTRGIRISFANLPVFKTQLRALLRAAYGRNLRIMFPMISSEWEVKRAIDIVNQTAEELKVEGVKYDTPVIGIMVETPAAVLTLDQLAPYVKFVSIGTNDLTQYTLALDRVNDNLSEYYIPHHDAILKLIEMTVQTAHKFNIEVGICGELGADTEMAGEFVRMGIDELSMAPAKILPMAEALKNCKKSTESVDVLSPVKGTLVPMEEIPDETFSSGVLGPCIGVDPDNNILYSPCDGEISMVAETGHAFGIRREAGDEILIHVGIDTVELQGKGFDNPLKVGQKVSVGEKLMSFDKDIIVKAGLSPMVVIVKLESR